MYYVYLIKSSVNGSYYVGYTADVEQRLKQHNTSKVRSTKPFGPYNLVYYEAYLDEGLAQKREQQLKKSRYKKEELINRINMAPSSNG